MLASQPSNLHQCISLVYILGAVWRQILVCMHACMHVGVEVVELLDPCDPCYNNPYIDGDMR